MSHTRPPTPTRRVWTLARGDHRAQPGIGLGAVVRLALVVLFLLTLAPAAVATASRSGLPAQEPPPQLKPVRIVVLVDESGSLSPADIARERDAARVIVQGEPSSESTVSVVGFASANAPGQAPVDPVCPPTEVNTPENRQFLADCVGRLRSRTPAQGADTDHVNALRQALSYLDTPGAGDQPKIVFLLTDGVLNVSNSPAYGKNLSPGDRNAAGRQQIPGVLNELSGAGVQVWPLGFGKVDRNQLESFATGAAQDGCGVRTPRPRASVIGGSADLLRAIAAASSAARCTSVSDPVLATLPSGGSVDLAVNVPAIASEGAILVFKRDPRVTVGYFDPQGTEVPTDGELGGSRFQVSGQNSGAEALRIVNPTPGQWTVRLSSAPGVPRQDVGALVVFQGAVRAVIAASPPAPSPGSKVEVTMQVRGTRAAITDPAQLRGLTFVTGLNGDGFQPVRPIELKDGDGDGQYRGRITVPNTATGRLNFVGSVTGIGVSGDERTFATQIAPGVNGVQGVLSLGGVNTDVVIGSSLNGSARVSNGSGERRQLRIEVAEPSPGTVVAVEPAQLTVPPSGQAVLPFTVRFDRATAFGPNQARLRLVDASNGALVGELLFSRNIVAEPTFFERLWWLWALLAIALVGGAVALLLWLRNRGLPADDVRGVLVELRRRGQVADTLTARSRGKEFRFGVRRGASAVDTALTAGAGGDRYLVRRSKDGPAVLGPTGAVAGPGAPFELGDGLELAVRDRRAVGRADGHVGRPRSGAVSGEQPRRRPTFDPYGNTPDQRGQ
jgi:von Willebrand factor type A domain